MNRPIFALKRQIGLAETTALQHNRHKNGIPKWNPLSKGGSVQRFDTLKLNTKMAASVDDRLTLITFVLIGSHTGAVTGSV